MGIIASLTVGVGGAFGLEALSGTVYGQRDGSERLSLPVFAVVPEDK
jgi:capsular polysaccharide biosynthesis protein